ncbi:uncharacterized protein K452DRAFT_284424 [Aplosporella prunicola CBS 121167]|uniref:Chitin-binding type-4 domain-containing protein n=1 Tax=Aplosporella prunicola CBS 121167 TaxID=1176127 RepID=A0A6A6BP84_9PEZI|nr:uncharacterized protein K452DRAFT_284424 [Aplosporella prunicola CBS 121167]KAF2145034.1 hypothetical protein K452DRAFT_284424 [Aplosporella prunicola CBS 121167]
MKYSYAIASLPALATTVLGHGFVTKPTARMPGDAMAAACGQQVYNNQKSDNYGNIQGELQVASSQSDYDAAKCDIWLCKGYKLADNKDNVQSYTAGQKVTFEVDVRAPHTGVANVSVIDTASHSPIGEPLISWDKYATTESGVKKTDTNFEVTMPSDLGSKCSTAGDCVLQWYWFAESIDQTYESCVDFTMSGSGSGSSSSSTGTNAKVAEAAVSSAASSTLATVATPATAATTAASSTDDRVAQLESLVPSSVLTSVLSKPTGSVSAEAPSTDLPEGTTVQDLMEWVAYYLNGMFQGNNLHARDVAPERR